MKTTRTKKNYTVRVRVGKPSYIDYDQYVGPRYSDRVYEERFYSSDRFDESNFSVWGARLA